MRATLPCASTRTRRAEIIALVDADDIVQPYYLRETVSYFSDPRLGFVQTCEGNRDYEGSAYYTACVDSYKGFYLAVMSSRNERDTVPFVGTMGLFRRSALIEVGGWNEWCISEDTEASLRVLKNGWSGVYIPRCFGRGIVPPTFAGLNTQRHRWCFGAMQILRLHWRSLMPWDRSPDNHLTAAQRRDYLMASFGWFRDLLMLGFALLLLLISGLLLSGAKFALMPLAGDKSLLPMSLIMIATICMTWTLRHWTTMSASPSRVGPRHQPVRQLDNRAGLYRGDVTTRGRVLADIEDRSRGASAAQGFALGRAGRLAGGGSVRVRRAARHGLRIHPILLIFIISLQGTVYLCAPIAALWNLRAQRVPAVEFRRRYQEQLARMSGDRRRSGRIAKPVAAVLLAAAIGVGFAFLAAPDETTTTPQHVERGAL